MVLLPLRNPSMIYIHMRRWHVLICVEKLMLWLLLLLLVLMKRQIWWNNVRWVEWRIRHTFHTDIQKQICEYIKKSDEIDYYCLLVGLLLLLPFFQTWPIYRLEKNDTEKRCKVEKITCILCIIYCTQLKQMMALNADKKAFNMWT